MSEPERILIVRLSHLGDVACTLGLFHALHEAYPRARIGWAVQPEFADLVAGLPGLDRVVPFGRREGWRAWPRLRRVLRDLRPDLVVDAQGNLKSAGVALLSGARRRAGPAREDWREPFGARVLNDPAPPSGSLHAVGRILTLARHVAPAAASPPRFDPALTPEELRRGEEHLTTVLPGDGEPVLFSLSSPEDVRGWGLDRWEELARHLRAASRPVLILSGPAEETLGRELERRLEKDELVGHAVGQRGLRELAALLSAAAGRDGTLITCDSGPMHLAWTVGLRVVALEGPQDARRTGPWPLEGAHAVVRAVEAPDCAPCLRRSCDHADGPVCMRRIDPAAVLSAL